MKTTILTIAIAILTVFGISQTASAATKTNETVSTVLTEVTRITKIEVHGNVELYLSDGATDQVKVYNRYYAESALVQDQNGVLRISSYSAKKLVVWVTAAELSSLSAYDNAIIKSFGKLSAIDLDVKLYNNASAQLTLDTYAATITLKDHATADVTGSADEATVKYDFSSTINTTGFAVARMIKTVKAAPVCTRDMPEFASL